MIIKKIQVKNPLQTESRIHDNHPQLNEHPYINSTVIVGRNINLMKRSHFGTYTY